MSFLFKGTKTTTSSTKIESFQATVCEFGKAVPLLYGTCRTSPNLINYQDFTATEHRVTQKSGKKSSSTTITYYYNCYLELAIGENIDSISAVWVGDKKYSGIAGLNAGGNYVEGAPLSVNVGNNPNPTTYMSQKHNSIACGYENLSYAYGYVFLGEDSASVPSYMFEVNGLLRNQVSNGVDANPAYVVKDILSRINDKLGKLTSQGGYVDDASFNNYARYCYEADLLVSTPNGKFNEQKKAADVIKELCDITNAYIYWNTDRIVFIPRDDRQQGDWQPNKQVLYDINANDLALSEGGIIGFKRKDSNEIYNYITVQFTNRSNDYEQESVSYQDINDIRNRGIKSVTLEALWLHTKEAAIRYAKAYARKSLTETNQYTLKLDWKYARLTAGDLIRVTDETMGLANQVMMVSEVQEDNHGLLTVTAIQRAAGNYSEAVYSVTDDYNAQNFNIEPSDTDAPLFIIPPADLVSTSSSGIEIWIALRGKSASWGGCSVYISDKDGEYTYYDKSTVSASYGKLITAMSANATSVDIRFDNPKTVELLTGSQYDAENGNTLIWINGECMSYTNATLIAANTYRLSGIIRGQHGTSIAAHAINDDMAVLDSGIFVLPLTKHYLGRTLYFKFPSFNVFQANEQSINDLDYYTCIVNTHDLPNCTSVIAYNKYREFADDITRYDIIVEWQPANFESYQQAQVWYKTSGTQAKNLGVIQEGTLATNLGMLGNWQYGGQGYNNVVIPQAIIGDTYKIAVCTQDIYGNTESPDMSPQVEILVASKTELPNTPSNLSINLTNSFNISWNEVRNADIRYYEVRLDSAVGLETSNLIARTTETKISTNAITQRSGNIYVFAISAYDKCSAPAKLTYNFPAPSAPTIQCESKLAGIECVSSAIPTNCNGVHWFFDGTDTDSDIVNSGVRYFFQANAGVYEISACYQDYFGDGETSGEQMISVLAYIDDSLIKSESITLEKLSADAQKAIEEGGIDTVNIAVKGMLGEGSALVLQPDGSYALVASNGETLTGMFANQSGVIRLQGKYIHLTGDTVIDGSVITNNMLAGGITADKINVSSLSAIKGTIGLLRTATSGARMELESNQLRVYDSNNVLRVRLGVW